MPPATKFPPDDALWQPLLDKLRSLVVAGPNRVETPPIFAENIEEVPENWQQGWPREPLAALAAAGVHKVFAPAPCGGDEWPETTQIELYRQLASVCLTTAFVLTQRNGALRRICDFGSPEVIQRWVPGLLSGELFGTVAISHLTTSRQHLGQAALLAEPTNSGWILNGTSPWVTGAVAADVIVTGATLPDGQQVLLAVPANLPGIRCRTPYLLLALNESCTGEVEWHNVSVPRDCLLAGPQANVLASPAGAKTGGLNTSALALGHAHASLAVLAREAERRGELNPIWRELTQECAAATQQLRELAAGTDVCPAGELRARANSLALRSAQASLSASKGTGFVAGHPAERFCREALFFLVWSCPQGVVNANLCEFARIET
ncbi:MAG: acyl-CoA dehydrogenase family protein [Pirellulales bacterium]|nr:acyl-CoA dehydrogenase family protein [Pirellulales bacterium]